MFQLTHKQLLELKFWLTDNVEAERAKLHDYLQWFGFGILSGGKRVPEFDQILEIGTGPLWGLLPYLRAKRKFGVDPLYPAYYALGDVLEDRNGILQIDEPFEHWDTNETFDAIFTVNALDHGEMGFYLLPKIWRMLRPGGLFYMHAHLRPKDLLNLVHDHALTEEQFDKHLSYTDLIEVKRAVLEKDIDGRFDSPALVGIWRKP